MIITLSRPAKCPRCFGCFGVTLVRDGSLHSLVGDVTRDYSEGRLVRRSYGTMEWVTVDMGFTSFTRREYRFNVMKGRISSVLKTQRKMNKERK